jgi:glutamate formiminotransferase
MDKIIECVPNISEAKDHEKVEKIVGCFRNREGVKLLDYSSDLDHNRSVITAAGEPEALKEAVVSMTGEALRLIDLNSHRGAHPRMGAVDVIPFVPIKNVSMEECVALSKDVGKTISEKFGIPVFLYEKSASGAERENLANIRKGEFEGLSEKMKSPDFKPDFGKDTPHKTFGAVAVGARAPLIAFNVNLGTPDIEIAKTIAKKARFISGGLPCVKAMGVYLKEKNIAQVSMNLTDYTKTGIYTAVELIRAEAAKLGVSVIGGELIGLVPLGAVADAAARYLQLESFSVSRILETKLYE